MTGNAQEIEKQIIEEISHLITIKCSGTHMLTDDEIVNRLIALLSLSPGERGFVRAGLDAQHAQDHTQAWDAAAILGDYYEESGDDASAYRVRLLRPQDGDILVMSFNAADQPLAGPNARRIMAQLLKFIEERGLKVVGLTRPNHSELTILDEEDMRRVGYVKASKVYSPHPPPIAGQPLDDTFVPGTRCNCYFDTERADEPSRGFLRRCRLCKNEFHSQYCPHRGPTPWPCPLCRIAENQPPANTV